MASNLPPVQASAESIAFMKERRFRHIPATQYTGEWFIVDWLYASGAIDWRRVRHVGHGWVSAEYPAEYPAFATPEAAYVWGELENWGRP